ncbi:MAG TPA: MBL fold metallo-hydrolase [Capillimicrobium sp.]|nr:MBL fold metallo-hydrolase [Capillimicrobium sp.]
MNARLLGWAGVQLRADGSGIVIDPLRDAAAVWAPAGDLARDVPLPPVVAAEPSGAAAAGLLTHLHRDHADVDALREALRPGAVVLVPAQFGGDEVEDSAVADARDELEASGLAVREVAWWESMDVDGWRITALPAADGTGDPQVSWLVQRDGATVLHAGDTLPHNWWWRIARRAGGRIDVAFLPINAPTVMFPHRQPPIARPIVMDGREAATAAAVLRAGRVVPIHYDGYDWEPIYTPDRRALETLRAAAGELDVPVEVPELGAWFDVAERVAA